MRPDAMKHDRMRLCNGVRSDPHEYPEELEDLFRVAVPPMRAAVEMEVKNNLLKDKELELGQRFYSNDIVLLTIRSAASVEEFWSEPFSWTRDALYDCASRDYWYLHEKEWDAPGPLDSRGFLERGESWEETGGEG